MYNPLSLRASWS